MTLPRTSGRLEVFASAGNDANLGHMWQTTAGNGWSNWVEIGPQPGTALAVFLNAEQGLEIFAGTGPDSILGHMWQTQPNDSASWSPWTSLGVAIQEDPTVFQNADGRLELFAIGADGNLGHMWQLSPTSSANWSGWAGLGPAIQSDPVVFANADGRLEVFATGPQPGFELGHIWQNAPNGATGWSAWTGLGPGMGGASTPSVFANADGRLEVFALAGGSLGHIWREPTGGVWSAWSQLVPSAHSSPAVFANADGRLEVFALGPDWNLGHIWQNAPNGTTGWSAWTSLGAGGSVVPENDQEAPTVFRNADGRLEVFGVNPARDLGHIWQQTTGGWSAWTNLGPGLQGPPVVASNSDVRPVVP